MNNNNILRSAYISLFIQFIIGLVSIHGILVPLSSKDGILNDIMMMELVVQFIEFSFYVWLVIQLSRMSFEVTYTRYFDWFISKNGFDFYKSIENYVLTINLYTTYSYASKCLHYLFVDLLL